MPLPRLRPDTGRIDEARARRLAWRDGLPTDRIPFSFTLADAPTRHTVGERVRDPDRAIEDALIVIDHQLARVPDTDFLPFFQTDYLGQGVLPSMFGARQVVAEHELPSVEGRVMASLERDLPRLPRRIDPDHDGWGPVLRDATLKFLDATHGEIPVGVCDFQSPYGLATKLVGNEDLMLAMFDTPELVHELLGIATDGIIDTIRAMQRWVGDPDLLVLDYVDPLPGAGVIVWDDYVSVLTPALHAEFARPYNLRLYETFGRGHLHTCGPYFPSFWDEVASHRPASVDLYMMRKQAKSRADLLALRDLAAAAGIRLTGSLASAEHHFFDLGDRVPPDEAFVRAMAAGGGLLWTAQGTEGDAATYLAMVRAIGAPAGA